MVKVTMENIVYFALPLDNSSKILNQKQVAQSILLKLEKKYNIKSHKLFTIAYDPVKYGFINSEDRTRWVTNYEVYIRSSIQYKFWIIVYKLASRFEL